MTSPLLDEVAPPLPEADEPEESRRPWARYIAFLLKLTLLLLSHYIIQFIASVISPSLFTGLANKFEV